VDKALPVVGVDQDMPNSAFAGRIGNPPVQPDPVSFFAFVFGEGNRRGPDVFAMTGQDNPGKLGLPAELIDYICGLSPVGVNQTAVDLHLQAVLTTVESPQFFVGQFLQGIVDSAFQASPGLLLGNGPPDVPQGKEKPFLIGPGAVIEHIPGKIPLPSAQHPEQGLLLDVDKQGQHRAIGRDYIAFAAIEFGGDFLRVKHILAFGLHDRLVLVLGKEGGFIPEPQVHRMLDGRQFILVVTLRPGDNRPGIHFFSVLTIELRGL